MMLILGGRAQPSPPEAKLTSTHSAQCIPIIFDGDLVEYIKKIQIKIQIFNQKNLDFYFLQQIYIFKY